MNRTDILDQLNVIYKENYANGNEVLTQETVLTDLGFDSLDTVEFIMKVEKEMNVQIPETVDFKKVADLINEIEKQ